MTIETLIWLIPLPPLLAFFLIVLFTNRSKGLSIFIAVGAAFLSWAMSMVVFANACSHGTPGATSIHLIDPLDADRRYLVQDRCTN